MSVWSQALDLTLNGVVYFNW